MTQQRQLNPIAHRVWTIVFTATSFATLALLILTRADPAHAKTYLIAAAAIVVWTVASVIPFTNPVAGFPVMLIIAPLVTSQRRFYVPTLTPAETLPPSIPPRDLERFALLREGLARAGFHRAAIVLMSGLTRPYPGGRQSEGVVECFEHTSGRKGAMVMHALLNPSPPFNMPTLRLTDTLPDKTWIVTGNSGSPGLFSPAPTTHGISLPGCTDVAELLAVHSAMLHRFAPGYAGSHPAPRGWLAALADENTRAREDWLARGFIIPTGTPGEFRMSVLRASLIGWGVMRPFVNIRRALRRRHHARLRAKLGV